MDAANQHYLGIDLGSSYTKFVVVDQNDTPLHQDVLPTFSRRREKLDAVVDQIRESYTITKTCTTGYGRNVQDSDVKKTELICASIGLSQSNPIHKCIIDIGGEDIKIIDSGECGEVKHFHMNDKCSAGTGAFITEIAEKAELEIDEMSDLAKVAKGNRTINSFCTVFAKTEILGWIFDGVPIEEIAKGIYLSITDRVCKMPIPSAVPLFLCGGVITHHPYLKDIMEARLGRQVAIAPTPLYSVALGAAILAHQSENNVMKEAMN